MANVQQKITLSVPNSFNDSQREETARLVINKILERTAKGIDLNGSAFAKYSQSYKDSLDFNIANKTSKVNLKLSGEMLSDLELLGHNQGFIVIGFEAGSDENDKAKWAADIGNGPSRKFLGISPRDFDSVISEVKSSQLEINVRQAVEREGTSIFRSFFGIGEP